MSRKIALFGLGQELDSLTWGQDTIVAVGSLDKTSNPPASITVNTQTVPVLDIAELAKLDFDFVVITDKNQFNNIYITCAKACIPQFKIISYDTYIYHVCGKVEYNVDDEQQLIRLIQENNISSVLDYDMYFADGVSTTRNRAHYAELNDFGLYIPEDIILTGISAGDYWPIYDNIYDHIHKSFDAIALQHFDVLLAMKLRQTDDYIQLINSTYGSWDYAVLQVANSSPELLALQQLDYASLGLTASWSSAQNTSWLILKRISTSTELYVICHKPYKLPKLSSIYHPIHAGKNGAKGFGLPGDDTGENISFMNPYINELTALYWIWKNTHQDIIGTAHYHRFFVDSAPDSYISESDDYLDEAAIKAMLKNHDIILRRSVPYGNTEDCFRKFLGYEFYEAAKELFERVILNIAPDYHEAFLFALSRHNCGHAFNMFITRRHVFEAYCSWLFPIILEAAARIDFTSIPQAPQSRVLGFFGEALLMPWLMKQRLRIKELPVKELSYNG